MATTLLKLSVEDYLASESLSEIRHEYHCGELIEMAGTTRNHNLIKRALAVLIENQTNCEVFDENVILAAQAHSYYFYPDVVLTCDNESGESRLISEPLLIAEVLSPSTENTDRNIKFKVYKTIPELQHYLLVSQFEPYVEIYSRNEKNSWEYHEYVGLEAEIFIPALKMKLPLKEIYRKAKWENNP